MDAQFSHTIGPIWNHILVSILVAYSTNLSADNNYAKTYTQK